MEGRGQRLDEVGIGQKLPSPNGPSFSTKIQTISQRARMVRNVPLRTLAHNIDREWLESAWKRIYKGGATGIDRVDAQAYEANFKDNLDGLLQRMRDGSYRAPPVRRVYIPKADGKERPLGIPTIEDKLAQRAIGLILSAIYEQDFLPMSFGFRQGKSAHDALQAAKFAITTQKVSWVVDADICSFFDEMDHEWMIKFLRHRVGDERVIRFVKKWLNAGVMEEGKLSKAASGAPQGGVISPILANIYLHYAIDLWVTKIVPKSMRGQMQCFRYADDILFCFQYRQDAIRFKFMLKERLSKFKLRLNEDKTKLCRFGRFAEEQRQKYGEKRSTFDFLGFTFYNRESKAGKYTVGTKTSRKRLCRSMNHVTEWCKANLHRPVEWQASYLNLMLRGHYQYYGVTMNFPSVAAYYRHVIWAWQRSLSRRSQRGGISWEKMECILQTYRLEKPNLPHSYQRTEGTS